jgi:hypothetical protein
MDCLSHGQDATFFQQSANNVGSTGLNINHYASNQFYCHQVAWVEPPLRWWAGKQVCRVGQRGQ